ncbi:hypothetical protein H072_5175 [Dactylellina haptotyla CBS 200.50]|uniref:ZZ-type domain-containing protein n=1 Tax=Dactylellina haptotyla (strain CBS 200.50) TaxID=1284197 RepID=S8AD91_DACHA|nr:hypothetical protein H072_5175 [Dactylellina haptotyla CBS 200.50]
MATGLGGGFSISSFLDQYDSGASTALTSNRGSSANGRGSEARRNGDAGKDGGSSAPRKDRPAPIGVPGRSLRDPDPKSGTSSPLNTFTPPISKALDATESGDAAEKKKRKLEDSGTDAPKKKSRFEGMTKEQKIAEVKRLKALRAAKEASKLNGAPGRDGNGSGSAASNPNSPITAEAPRKPVKGSYAEIMERAKQLQATSAVPAKIVHKETKVERKKLSSKAEKIEPGKKAAAGPSKTQTGKPSVSSAVSKHSPAKKTVGRPSAAKKPEPSKTESSKPKVQTVEWKGTARPSAAAPKPASSKPSSRPSERDRERERGASWERERESSRYRSPVKRYRYAESEEEDYYSDSDDMEAAGIDILEEEEFSHKVGFREDLEAEKLERELAARKAKNEQVSKLGLSKRYDNSESSDRLVRHDNSERGGPTARHDNSEKPGIGVLRNEAANPREAYAAANGRFETEALELPKPEEKKEAEYEEEKKEWMDYDYVEPPPPPGKICDICKSEVNYRRPTFQCTVCIEFEICGECYTHIMSDTPASERKDTNPEHENSEHAQFEHRFEAIPPISRQSIYIGYNNWRPAHWEPMIDKDGWVSKYFFELSDLVMGFWEQRKFHGLFEGKIPLQAIYYMMEVDPEECWATKHSAYSEETCRELLTKTGIEYEDVEVLDFKHPEFITGNEKNPDGKLFIQMSHESLLKLWLVTLLSEPLCGFGRSVIQTLNVLSPYELRKLPPGRPRVKDFPKEGLEVDDLIPYLETLKFPSDVNDLIYRN